MKYEIVPPEGLSACEDLIADSGYYDAVQLSDIGGIVMGAYDGESLVGCVWACLTGNRAYTDYLVVSPAYTGLGVRLQVKGLGLLKAMGVHQVISLLHHENTAAIRISERLGSQISGPYGLSILKLGGPNGQEEG